MAMILVGEETLVNPYTDGDQFGQKVTALESGGWVVTWQSDGQDGSGMGVYQQAYDADGTTSGVYTRVNNFTANHQYEQQVTALEGGGWVVTWVSSGQDGSSLGVYQRVYDAAGSAGAEVRVNTFVANGQHTPQITALDGGGWAVTWISANQDGDASGVHQRAYSAAGVPIGIETRVNTYTTGSQEAQNVTALEGGGWVVTWVSANQDGDSSGVYSQVYNAAGLVIGAETRVNTYTADAQSGQKVAALEGGGWVVTWESNGQDGASVGIFQQAYDANGVKAGGETQVNFFTAGTQNEHQVAALDGGGWVVTWESNGQDGSGEGIYCQAFAANGNRVGNELRVNTFANGDQIAPKVAALAGGGWVVTWQSHNQDGSGWGVYQKAFHFNQAPVITSNGGGAAVAVNVAENTTAVTVVTSTDPDGQSRTYSISGGADAAKFQINATTGALSFKAAPDFEAPGDAGDNNVYNVAVRASDGDLTDTQAIAVTVTNVDEAPADVNEAPTSVSLSNASMKENRSAGTVVGLLDASDPDGDAVTYALTSNPGGFFEIVGNELRLAKPLDFETQTSHAIAVLATDPGGLAVTENFVIAVGDVIDVVKGTAGNDKLTGAGHAEDIRGLAGNDRLAGGMADDRLKGGDGNDMLIGGAGTDKLKGGKGKDTASYVDAVKKVVASLRDPDKNAGGAKGDGYEGIENLTGSKLADKLTGNKKANVLKGGKGGDELTGGKGGDTLVGNKGADDLVGGENADSFVFKSVKDSLNRDKAWDVIADFSRKQRDEIDLSAIDARTGKGNQAFVFVGDDAFSGKKGELRYQKKAEKTFVYGDTDGDAKADFRIEIAKAIDLKEGDFVL